MWKELDPLFYVALLWLAYVLAEISICTLVTQWAISSELNHSDFLSILLIVFRLEKKWKITIRGAV